MSLYDRFNSFYLQNGWQALSSPVLMAISGGVDSMVLAHLLLKMNIPIAAAHCNFHLRGSESDGDEALVRAFAEQHNFILHVHQVDTLAIAQEWKKGIEETARIVRYDWFHQLRKTHGYIAIATAHHSNDNAETLLMNLCKGTGIKGLHGILPEQNNIIRPLLFASKEEIQSYANQHLIPFREDSSNEDVKYLRNAVRHHIMPAIIEHFPHAIDNINHSIQRFAEAEILYMKEIERQRKSLLEQRGQDYYIPIKKLTLRKPLATIVYELVVPFQFSSAQIPEILKLLSAESGHYISSATHRIIRNRDFLVITALPTQETDLIVIDTLPFEIQTAKHHWTGQLKPAGMEITADSNIAYIDTSSLELPLILRKWKIGDYCYPMGMKMKKKKVSKLLIEHKIPLHEKEHIWVLEHHKKIVWVAGIRLDERFKITPQTREVLCIKRRLV